MGLGTSWKPTHGIRVDRTSDMKAAAVLAIVCATVVAGCGGSDESSHEQKVHQAARVIRSIDREDRTLSEIRLSESELQSRGDGQSDPETIELLEQSELHRVSSLIRSSTPIQIDEACEEVSESVFCRERKLAGQR
jgi:hypothetical protein